MNRALLRYRIMAYATGVGLLVLCCIGVPLNHAAHQPIVVAVVGPLHGALYILYLLTCLDLAFRDRWALPRIILTMLAGTIPVMSFVAERKITAYVESRHPELRSRTRTTSEPATRSS